MTTFSNWFLFYSDKLMPDIYVALSVILSLFIIDKYKFKRTIKNTIFYSLLFVLALFFGFLAKETVILIFPLLLYLVVVDFIFKRNIRFWLWSISIGVFLISLYLLITGEITGDFLKRFEAIIQNSYLNHCSYDKQPVAILLKRISWEFVALTIYQMIFPGYVFILAFIFKKQSRSHIYVNNTFSLFYVSAIILFLSSNFMSVSITSYVPMCLDPRHYLFLIPVAAIPAAKIISAFIKDKSDGLHIILTLGLVVVISIFLPGRSFRILYMPLLVLFSAYFFFKNSLNYKRIFLSVFVLLMALTFVDAVIYADKVNYKKQKEVVFRQIFNKSERYYIITDEVQKRLGYYYTHFNDEKYSFVSFDNFSFDTLDDRKKLLLLNGYTMYLSNMTNTDLPLYARRTDTLNNLLYENKELNISIYKLDRIQGKTLNDTVILHSFNGFEGKIPYWKQNDDDITNSLSFGGKHSISVNEYSSTFSYPLDSLHVNPAGTLLFTSSLYCNFSDKTDSKLVLSLEDKDGIYIWEAIEIEKYIKAYSNWWPVKFEYELSTDKIRKSSVLKVYLWNIDKEKGWIDDFDITIKVLSR